MSSNYTKHFLESLYGTKPDETYILLWERLERKRSYWFKTVAEAVTFAAAHNVNLYAGVALSPQDYGPHNRCKAKNAVGLVGVFADLDVAGPGHKIDDLPATMSDALAILPPNFVPSMILDSGHGLQAWWLFEKPWIFGDAEERASAQELTKAWHRCIEARAAAQGCKVDAVHDLARVLRVPGTINRKDGLPDVEARIIEINDVRYNVEDFAGVLQEFPTPMLVNGTGKKASNPKVLSEPLVTRGDCPPGERVDPYYLLGMAYEKVAQGNGRNNSGFWLACQFRDNGFTIADALQFGPEYVARAGGVEPYTLAEYNASVRSAYSQPAREPLANGAVEPEDEVEAEPEPVTGEVAAEPAQRSTAVDDGDDDDHDDGGDDDPDDDRLTPPLARSRPESGPQPGPPPGIEEEKRVARAMVSRILGLDLVKVEKHGTVKGHYRLHLADGRQFDIGDAKVLDTQAQFRVAVIDGLNQQIPRLERKRWDRAVAAMLKLVEIIDTYTPAEMLGDELQAYLCDQARFCDSIEGLRADPEVMAAFFYEVKRYGAPIVETIQGGRVILSLVSFVAWVHRKSKTSLTTLEFANLLSRFGFKKVSTIASATFKGKREKLNRVWVADLASLPIQVTDEHEHRMGLAGVVAIRNRAVAGD
jgi:hypothetical protein